MNAFIALFSYMHCVCASSSSVEMTRRENKSDNDVITYIIYAWSAKASLMARIEYEAESAARQTYIELSK